MRRTVLPFLILGLLATGCSSGSESSGDDALSDPAPAGDPAPQAPTGGDEPKPQSPPEKPEPLVAKPVPRPAPERKDPPIPADTEIQTTESGIQYSVIRPGKGGKSPKNGDKVKLNYTGWLTNGTMFDTSRAPGKRPIELPVGSFVPGWNEIVQMMTVGARWKVTIPPELGYGKRGSPPTIPPDATLVFDMELLEFLPTPEFTAFEAEGAKETESGLKYQVLEAGSGEPAGATSGCEFHYAFWSTKGKLIGFSRAGGKPIQAQKKDVKLPFLSEGPFLMPPGAHYRFEVPPKLAFGEKPTGPDLPPNSVTIWEIEVLRVAKPLPLPEFAALDPEKTIKTASGLKYQVLTQGDLKAASPKLGESVTVHYCGWLTDGTQFDASFARGFPASFQLGRVIPGWNEGLALMKPGGSYRFEIPSKLAYKERGAPPSIPANATLIFHVELIKIDS